MSTQYNIKLPDELMEAIRKQAALEYLPMASLIRKAVLQYLKHVEDKPE